MIPQSALRDLDEMIPGNNLDYCYGSDEHENRTDIESFKDLQSKIIASMVYEELVTLRDAFPADYQVPTFDALLEMITNA